MYISKEAVTNIIKTMPNSVKFVVRKNKDIINNTDRIYLTITSDYYYDSTNSQDMHE